MIIPIDVKPPKRVEKVWGYELWIHNDEEYCGKSLVFPKQGNYFSIKEGDSVLIERGQPHQLISLEDNSIVFEVSTQHFDEDSYRIYRDTPNDLL